MKVCTLIPPIMRWITLTFAGGLGYALVRGLWAVRYLGAPIYDWFWYVPVIAVLIGPPVSFALRLQRKSTLLIFAMLLVFALAGYNGFGQVVQLEPGNAPPVPISFWAFSDFRHTPAAILQDLEANGGRIYLHVGDYPFNQVRGQDLIERLRPLNGYNIEVYLVPPAPDFLSSPVYREWSNSVRALAAFVKREGLTDVRGLIVVFQLDGALQQFGQDFVRRLTSAVNGPQPDLIVPFSRPASMLVYSAAAADALLDMRGQRVWLWIVWAIVCAVLVRARNCP